MTILACEKEGQVLGSVAYPDGPSDEEIEWLFVSEKQNRKIAENTPRESVALYMAEQNIPSVTLLAKVGSRLCITGDLCKKTCLDRK